MFKNPFILKGKGKIKDKIVKRLVSDNRKLFILKKIIFKIKKLKNKGINLSRKKSTPNKTVNSHII